MDGLLQHCEADVLGVLGPFHGFFWSDGWLQPAALTQNFCVARAVGLHPISSHFIPQSLVLEGDFGSGPPSAQDRATLGRVRASRCLTAYITVGLATPSPMDLQ